MIEIKPAAQVMDVNGSRCAIEWFDSNCRSVGALLYSMQTCEALQKENAELQKQISWLSTPYLDFLSKWCTEYEDLKNDFELYDEWARQEYDENGLRIKRAYTRLKQVMKSRRLEGVKLIEANEAQAKRIAELEGIFKMLALRAKSFPTYPIGSHIPEVFFAIGESSCAGDTGSTILHP